MINDLFGNASMEDAQFKPPPNWILSELRPALPGDPSLRRPFHPTHLPSDLEPYPARLEGHQVDVQIPFRLP